MSRRRVSLLRAPTCPNMAFMWPPRPLSREGPGNGADARARSVAAAPVVVGGSPCPCPLKWRIIGPLAASPSVSPPPGTGDTFVGTALESSPAIAKGAGMAANIPLSPETASHGSSTAHSSPGGIHATVACHNEYVSVSHVPAPSKPAGHRAAFNSFLDCVLAGRQRANDMTGEDARAVEWETANEASRPDFS